MDFALLLWRGASVALSGYCLQQPLVKELHASQFYVRNEDVEELFARLSLLGPAKNCFRGVIRIEAANFLNRSAGMKFGACSKTRPPSTHGPLPFACRNQSYCVEIKVITGRSIRKERSANVILTNRHTLKLCPHPRSSSRSTCRLKPPPRPSRP